ncbi:MAG: hypothetical protein WC054_00930 [Candidatus Nanopelagicales bacterium]
MENVEDVMVCLPVSVDEDALHEAVHHLIRIYSQAGYNTQESVIYATTVLRKVARCWGVKVPGLSDV